MDISADVFRTGQKISLLVNDQGIAGPHSGAKAVAGPRVEAQAQPNPQHGVCPRCPTASAQTAGKAAAAGSIKPKCFLFQTIKRLHDTRGAKRREETLHSLLLAPLPTPAARRDGVQHRAGTRVRGRTGKPQAPRARGAAGPRSEPPLSVMHQLEPLSRRQTQPGMAMGHWRQLGMGDVLVPRQGCSERLQRHTEAGGH